MISDICSVELVGSRYDAKKYCITTNITAKELIDNLLDDLHEERKLVVKKYVHL